MSKNYDATDCEEKPKNVRKLQDWEVGVLVLGGVLVLEGSFVRRIGRHPNNDFKCIIFIFENSSIPRYG